MLALVIPSASNLDESNIKHAKVFNVIVKVYLNGEFIEVPLIHGKIGLSSVSPYILIS